MMVEYDADNAHEAMRLLGMADYGEAPPGGGPATRPFKLETWVTQLALSRPGRRSLDVKAIEDIKRFTLRPERIKWPRGRGSA